MRVASMQVPAWASSASQRYPDAAHMFRDEVVDEDLLVPEEADSPRVPSRHQEDTCKIQDPSRRQYPSTTRAAPAFPNVSNSSSLKSPRYNDPTLAADVVEEDLVTTSEEYVACRPACSLEHKMATLGTAAASRSSSCNTDDMDIEEDVPVVDAYASYDERGIPHFLSSSRSHSKSPDDSDVVEDPQEDEKFSEDTSDVPDAITPPRQRDTQLPSMQDVLMLSPIGFPELATLHSPQFERSGTPRPATSGVSPAFDELRQALDEVPHHTHPYLDMQEQQALIAQHRQQKHFEYCNRMSVQQTMSPASRCAAQKILLNEAHRHHIQNISVTPRRSLPRAPFTPPSEEDDIPSVSQCHAVWKNIGERVLSDLCFEGYLFVQRRVSCMCVFDPLSHSRTYDDGEQKRRERMIRQEILLEEITEAALLRSEPCDSEPSDDPRDGGSSRGGDSTEEGDDVHSDDEFDLSPPHPRERTPPGRQLDCDL